jgi:ABC-type polysaccharide/polyol phosphate transport system ATPase subunit
LQTECEPPAIELAGVSKRFDLREATTLKEYLHQVLTGEKAPALLAVKDVSFSVQRGETFGIIGANGSGKTTLLRLIAGVTQPTKGQIFVNGRVCPLLSLGAGFHPELSGEENVYLNASLLGMDDALIRARFNDIVEFAELADFMSLPVRKYSSGMYVRLGFAIAVHCEPDILLVDEALSVGDSKFQAKCLQRMHELQAAGVTIVLVSHNLELVQRFCQRVLLLNRGLVLSIGEPESIISQYREMLFATAPADPSLAVSFD